jgi:2'-5' RNA ligase superfamily protein
MGFDSLGAQRALMPLTARALAQAVLGGTYKDRGWNVGAFCEAGCGRCPSPQTARTISRCWVVVRFSRACHHGVYGVCRRTDRDHHSRWCCRAHRRALAQTIRPRRSCRRPGPRHGHLSVSVGAGPRRGRCGQFPDVLFLVPDPDDPFRRLTAEVFQRWPDAPPYAGLIIDPVPHLTITHGASPKQAAEVEADVTARLPFTWTIREAWLIGFDGTRWTHRVSLPLGTVCLA